MSEMKRTSVRIRVEPPKAGFAKALLGPDGSFQFLDANGNLLAPEFMEREAYYEAASGRKVRSRHSVKAGYVSVGGFAELSRFTTLFAIDTNTRVCGRDVVSVAAFIKFHLVPEAGKFRVVSDGKAHFYEFRNIPDPASAELLAILKIANDVRSSAASTGNDKRFAFITDHGGGGNEHAEINAGARRIYRNHRLPRRFELIYARDKGHELQNRLVKGCDRLSNEYFRLRDRGELPPKEYLPLPEDRRVSYLYRMRNDVTIENALQGGMEIAPGSVINVYEVEP